MKHSEIADLSKKGFRPRILNGKVTTLVEIPKDTVLVKKRSVLEQVEESKAKAEANAQEIEKLKPAKVVK